MNIDTSIFEECPKSYAWFTKTGKRRKQTKLWKMRDGTKIRICDMDDGHLANIISYLERFARHKLHDTLMFYLSTPGPRGDMAQMAFDREFDYWTNEATWKDVVPIIYWNLIHEKERRKNMEKKFFIAGVQHHPGMKAVIEDLKVGMVLDLVPDPENKFDPNAVRIQYEDNMLGYVPKLYSSEVSAVLEVDELKCVIERLDSKSPPWEQCMVTVKGKEEANEVAVDSQD